MTEEPTAPAEQASDNPVPPEEQPEGLPFPVVGIGASAGGLDAVTRLLEGLPAEPGLAFLVVLHLDPHFKSELPALLGAGTALPVHEGADGMAVEVNHVYVAPPGTTMTLADGKLSLAPRPPRGVPMPIDHLFRSLASVQKGRSIGVILSGDGTDGTLGFQTIKGVGGITFAQDEKSARHDSMPRSAALDGHVDYVLPPQRIALELLRIARHPYSNGQAAPPAAGEGDEVVDQVIALMRSRTDVDFTHYKRTTIRRRIGRRMALRGL